MSGMNLFSNIKFPVADAHNDFLLRMHRGAKLGAPVGSGHHMTLEGMRAGGVKLAFFAVFPIALNNEEPPVIRAMRMIRDYHAMVEEYGLVHLAPGMGSGAIGEGHIGTLLTIEGGDALAGRPELLDIFHRLGVRLITLTWNHRNELADGVEEADGLGLTACGREAVREMNRLKMIVDLSHISEAGFWDVMGVTQLPAMASHSNARAVCGHHRNLTDEQITALKEAGGFIGLNFLPEFLADDGRATVRDLVRHVDHFAQLGALGNLGIGSDYDGMDSTPHGLGGPQDFPRVWDALLEAGYTERQVSDIAYGNLARYLEEFS